MEEQRTRRATGRVLVVDDDEGVRALLSSVLTWSSWDVTACKTGAAGLRAIRTEPFDIAIVDLGLSDITGIGLLERLTSEAPDVTIVVMTGRNGDHVPSDRLEDLGVRAVLLKPFDLDQLEGLMSVPTDQVPRA